MGLLGTLASSFFEETAIAMGNIWTGALFSSGLDLTRTIAILVTALITAQPGRRFSSRTSRLPHAARPLLGYVLGLRRGWVGFKWNTELFRAVWKYAFPVSVAWGFGILVNFSDQVILAKFVSPAEFAFYSIGCLTVPPLIILGSVDRARADSAALGRVRRAREGTAGGRAASARRWPTWLISIPGRGRDGDLRGADYRNAVYEALRFRFGLHAGVFALLSCRRFSRTIPFPARAAKGVGFSGNFIVFSTARPLVFAWAGTIPLGPWVRAGGARGLARGDEDSTR